jgi:spore coat polysaccharide biosynthesis protein SpsF
VDNFKTDQESFWAGEFGNEYIKRNAGDQLVANNIFLFSNILKRTDNIQSLLEFGANIGLNLKAIRAILPKAQLSGIEINQLAADELESWGEVDEIYRQSILDFQPPKLWDLVLIKTVLIHINPSHLNLVYDALFQSSRRYILVVEYYNPSPVEVTYRGHSARLFKRDFAGELLDRFPLLRLVDYGFVYKRDPNFPQDDCTWFLLEKCET